MVLRKQSVGPLCVCACEWVLRSPVRGQTPERRRNTRGPSTHREPLLTPRDVATRTHLELSLLLQASSQLPLALTRVTPSPQMTMNEMGIVKWSSDTTPQC